jgi:16S rRNA (cytosine967-C5)-methyltransferase
MSTQTGTRTRTLAIDALVHVLTRNQHADSAMEKLFNTADKGTPLRPLDRAFVFEMVYGTLRWLGKIDWILGHMVSRPMASLDPRVVCALRVGTYQIFYMDRVPDRAAVSETVEAVKKMGAHQASSFVNAILRRVAKKAEYFPKPNKETETVDYLAMQFAHPKWMVERWISRMNQERLEHMLSAHNTPPLQSLRVVTRKMHDEPEPFPVRLLRESGVKASARPLPGCWRVESLPNFSQSGLFQEGKFFVQEEAAQVASSIIAPLKGDTVFDACSAPGGKSLHLWAEGLDPKNLTLCDSSAKRVTTLQQNLDRMGLLGARLLVGDLASVAPGEQFSKVVLDAPCSSFGVIRRHPEIKWLRTLGDVERCASEQRRLLEAASAKVAPNGELIYMVCSHETEETTANTSWFLQNFQHFEVAPLDGRIHDFYKKYVTAQNEFLVMPGNTDQLDGFYAVVFKKKGAP